VAREVVAAVELDRVHEDGDDDAPRSPPRLGDQGDVPLVERAHGGHERDALAPRAGRVRPRLHGARLADGLHQPALAARGAKACASVGKRPPFTSATYSPAGPTTGTSIAAIASMVRAIAVPPSSLTASAPPSFTRRTALSTARRGLAW